MESKKQLKPFLIDALYEALLSEAISPMRDTVVSDALNVRTAFNAQISALKIHAGSKEQVNAVRSNVRTY